MPDIQQDSESQGDEDCFPPLIHRSLVLTGPTASGKSSVAMALAQRLDGEIISLDSIAVYQGMDIGTAKASPECCKLVPHHLIDLVPPSEDFSVACYLRRAHATIDQITSRGKLPIIVGGTPMFLKGVLRGFDPGPPADWDFRDAVESDVREHGVDALRQRLEQVDPLAAHRIGPNDTRRMIRALEVARQTGTPISHRQVQFDQASTPDACNVFALSWPREQLHQRINQRVAAMFDEGLIDEVRELLSKHGGLSRTAAQAVGYREVIAWLDSNSSQEQLQEEVAAHTRQLARRQETWFRSFDEIRAVQVSEPMDVDAVASQIESMMIPIDDNRD